MRMNLLSPKRQCVVHLQQRLGISERRACRTIGQTRTIQRKPHRVRDDEAPLTTAIIRLASAYGRYGYRCVTALLRGAGWRVNRQGLQCPEGPHHKGSLFSDRWQVWNRIGHHLSATQHASLKYPPVQRGRREPAFIFSSAFTQ